MLEDFLKLVDPALHGRSGSVTYAGAGAFGAPSDLYVLGLNPGGSPDRADLVGETVAQHMRKSLDRKDAPWSEYLDEAWEDSRPGESRMQRRVLHLLRQIGRDPRAVPASNVVFLRSRSEAALAAEKAALLATCWPMHEAVIERLGVRTVICLGHTAGNWVRDALGAHKPIGEYIEQNNRRWRSRAWSSPAGVAVVSLSHPGRADWTARPSDPSDFVRSVLHRPATVLQPA